MTNLLPVFFAVAVVLNQLAYEWDRQMRRTIEYKVMMSRDPSQSLWDFLATLSILCYFSILPAAILFWVWWQYLILWFTFGLAATLFARQRIFTSSVGRMAVLEKLVRVASVVVVAIMWTYIIVRG